MKDWAAKWAVYSPEKIAIREFETDKILTYKDLHEKAMALAQWLKTTFQIQKGDRVAVLADFCLEYVALFSAAQKLGFALVPLNYRLTAHEILFLCQDAKPSLVIFEKKYHHLLSEVADTEGGVRLISLENIFDISENSKKLNFENEAIKDDDAIFILYTSGTTGFPKGAIYTHKMLFWNSINTAMSLIINAESRTVVPMPPFHTGGWNVLLTPFLHHGGYVCLMKKFDAAAILDILQREKMTIFMGVPTMLKMMSALPEFEAAHFTHLHYIIVGGEAMPIPLIETWHAKNVPIRQGYGMTEVGPNLTSLHQDDAIRKKGSIGRPNFYVQTRILDENGNENNNGELLLRGDMVTLGYWQNPEATTKAIDKNGWFRTGDRVFSDEEGYLYIVDRIKNMFISGGENVYPAEIERVALQHDAISEVAVIGVADEKWGEVGKMFVVLRPDYAPTEGVEILDFLKGKLAKYKIPKYLVFLEALPKNDTGKINRQALKNG
jgi:fatty-acyl-CoA synthase